MSKMIQIPTLDCVTVAKSADADVVVVFRDSDKKAHAPKGAYNATVKRLSKSEAFTAGAKSSEFVRFGAKGKTENVLFVGMGKMSDLTEETARVAGGVAWGRIRSEKCHKINVWIDAFEGPKAFSGSLSQRSLVRAFAEGLILASYKYRHRTEDDPTGEKTPSSKKQEGPYMIHFVTKSKTLQKEIKEDLQWASVVGETVGVTRVWSDLPPNIGTPEYYAADAKKLAGAYGLKCKVLTEKDAAREKMNLFLAVGKGSEREGRIVVLEYVPKGQPKGKTVALVGKGITFDTGGISLKPAAKMDEMKHDMTGAATMMGAILLAAKMKVPNRVVAILAFTENMPAGMAIVPGTVIRSRAGKTVEIGNTDAEGRLILADALDYAHDFKPDVIIDAATLTGAVLVALGRYCCGLMGNDQKLVDELREAGAETGERLWQLPLYEEYFEDMKSEYADMNNIGANPQGGTIRAGMFLKQFIKKGTRWAHLDIAGTATDLSYLSYCPRRGASGTYVRTLAQFISKFGS